MKTKTRIGTIICLFLFTASIGAQTVLAAEDPLVVGIFPRRSAEKTFKLFNPMAEYLSIQLGREVKIDTRKDFKAFWEQVEAGTYDIIHYNQYHYIKAHKNLGHQVIVRNEEMGSSLIGGAIFVKKDGDIEKIQDLKGKKIVFGGGKGAMQSYILATYLLRQGGLNDGDYIEDFAINPPSAIKAVFFNQAIAGGAGDVVVKLPVVAKSINIDDITMLAQSERYAHLPWAVKGDMDPGLRDNISKILISLKDSSEGLAVLKVAKLNGLVETTDSDYNPHREIVKEIKGEEY
jgi:phosphonate transport system substrate-binding protein